MKLLKDNERFLLEEIIKKNFTSKYKDSVLGIFWSVIQPLLIMIMLTIIFSTLFHRSIENYPVYLLSGRCVLSFFNASVGASIVAIKGNKNILKKIAAPKHIFILGVIASEGLTFIISILLLVGVMIVTNSPFHFITMPLAIIPIISLIIMLIGIGLIVSIICVYYSDIQHFWRVASLMIMYASAVFYPMSMIPQPYQGYLLLNPVYWIINQFRAFFVYGTIPNLLNVVNSLLLSSIILVFGIIFFKTYEKQCLIRL